MKLSKEKRNHLIGVIIGTVVTIVVLWFFLIGAQTNHRRDVDKKIADAKGVEFDMQTAVKLSGQIQTALDSANEEMSQIETEMASGDLYSWMYNSIKDFKAAYPTIEIPQFSSVEQSDCDLLYKSPFKQVKMTVNGSAYFHDLGKFIADFENHFPHLRVQNLELTPNGSASSTDRDKEKLSFRMEIIALANPLKSSDNK